MVVYASSLLAEAPADPALSPATDRSWQISSFAEAAGVQHERVFDLAFEPDGRVWIAATDGLHSYDGYHWRVFGKNDGLPSNYIRTVLFTSKGELWVGS